MKGLLLKDLLNLKNIGRTYVLILIFYAFLSFFNGSSAMLGGFLAILAAMLPITAMSYDERAKWDKFALTLPVSRKDVVWSKYLLGLIASAAAFVLCLPFGLLAKEPFSDTLLMNLLFFGIGIFYQSILLPILFRVGTEKSRIIMMAAMLIPTILILVLVRSGVPMPGGRFLSLLPYAGAVLLAALYCASVSLSLHIYQEKDL